jgi:hypothetical protein
MDEMHGEYFEGVVKTKNSLISILKINAVLRMSEADSSRDIPNLPRSGE